jgi:alkylation response protein AidB-like acyl-CoA dehydrogenase
VCYGLNEYGTDAQKTTFLKDLASGRKLGAFALSEPEAGSDASNQRTLARRDGDKYILNGTKNWTTNGSTADLVLVMAATDSSKGAKGISTFVVEKGDPLEVARRRSSAPSSDTVSLSFTDVVRRRTGSVKKEMDSGLR